MKILWMYQYVARYDFDKWFHLELVRDMRRLGHDVVCYGRNIEKGYPDLVEVPWSPAQDWDSLVKELKVDVAIMNTKSRMFQYYHPIREEMRDSILPVGFDSSSIIPKVMIEEDYHYEKNDDWYHSVGVSLLIQRHYSQSLRQGKVKTRWLPFSVDTKTFAPGEDDKRINEICFAGSITPPYPERKLVCDSLEPLGLITAFKRCEKQGASYVKCLKDYVSHVSGSSMYDICAAKNFEIMSSGSLLFTNKFSGIDLLFPADCYCEYELDTKNIKKQAIKILYEPEYVRETVANGLKCIKENHTNEIRTNQLLEMLRKEL